MRGELLAFAAFAMFAVEIATAQEQGKLRGNGGAAPDCIGWLSMASVRQELKLQPEQAEKARVLARDSRERWEVEMKKLEGLPRKDLLLKISALADVQYEEGMKALGPSSNRSRSNVSTRSCSRVEGRGR